MTNYFGTSCRLWFANPWFANPWFASLWFASLFSLGFGQSNLVSADEIGDAIKTIQKIDRQGTGHDEAIKAMKILNQCSMDHVPQLLRAMNQSNALGRNWLRAAISSAVSRGGELPSNEIREYFDNKTGSHLGRLLAFELLTENNQSLAENLVPKLFDDPSLPLRRLAIKSLVEKSTESEAVQKIGMLGFALNHARDVDQVQQIKKALSKNGIEINLTRQLGYFSKWQLVGPFDNSNQKGFGVALGPEKSLPKIDLNADYEDGKSTDDQPAKVSWSMHTTLDEMGVVDLNKVIGKVKGASVYAYAEFESEEQRQAEIRIGCINANKVWVNGELVISNEIYHVGMSPDQYSGKTKLKKGTNQILFKICQNEMTQPWAQDWSFQMRICDLTGKAIHESDPAPTRAGGE